MMAYILAIDDESEILKLIRHTLESEGHTVQTLADPSQVLQLPLGKFQLILLDVMMPEIDGFTLCQQIRNKVDIPILFLTAKAMEKDVVHGLSIGADDYIVKPFGIQELRARVGAHLRREKREKRSMLHIGPFTIDLSGKQMFMDAIKIPLTKSEYEICELLALHRAQVFPKEKIYEHVAGFDGEGHSSAITEHIKNIRAKCAQHAKDPIETIWGIGYRWRT